MKSKLFLSMFALTLLPVLAAAQTSIVAYSPHYSTNKKVLIAEVEYPRCAESVDYKYEDRANISSVNEEIPFTSMTGKITWENPDFLTRRAPVIILCNDGQEKDNE